MLTSGHIVGRDYLVIDYLAQAVMPVLNQTAIFTGPIPDLDMRT